MLELWQNNDMKVQCTCGKRVSLDASGKGVCDNCGYAFVGAGIVPKNQSTPQHSLERKPRNQRKVYATNKIEKRPKDIKAKRPITTRISARIKLAISGQEDKGGCFGCGVSILLILGAVFAVDLFFINPARMLPCSHKGHDKIVFGLIPFGHSCDGSAALAYIKRARVLVNNSATPVKNFAGVVKLAGIAALEMPFDFEFYAEDNEYLILANDENGISYFVDSDGTVYYDTSAEVDSNSPVAGSLE